MIEDEVGKYRKKSTARGLPRSKHKHIYETVLLIRHHEVPDIKTGKTVIMQQSFPTKVCTICGRIEETDTDDKWYEKTDGYVGNLKFVKKELSKAAQNLPVWVCSSWWDKFATLRGDSSDD